MGGTMIGFDIAPNTGPQRSANIYMAGIKFTIVQASYCGVSLPDSSALFGPQGGIGRISLNSSGANCQWNILTPSVPWITLTNITSGTGSAVTFFQAAADSGADRRGSIPIADQSSFVQNFTVYQYGSSGSTFTGFVDEADCNKITGWAADRSRLNTSINISIYDNGNLLTTVLANRYLLDVGIGLNDNGNHGFSIPTPASLRDNRVHSIEVRFTDNNAPLTGGGSLQCEISKVALWSNSYWFVDANNNHMYDGPPGDEFIQWGPPGVVPVMGDWNGDGTMKIGLYYQGLWYLDYNGNGIFEPNIDKVYNFGTATSTPVVGDWNGDGRSKIGIYQSGVFILDINGDGVFEPGTDYYFGWGPTTGAQPVIGDWNGDGRSKVGIFKQGFWALDYNGDGIYEPGTDKFLQWGQPTGIPIVGDWNGSGTTKIGSWSLGPYGPNVGQFVLDVNGDYAFEPGTDAVFAWGDGSSVPVVGDWNGDGRGKIGVFSNGVWVLDMNGGFTFDAIADAPFQFGGCGSAPYPCGQIPVPGRW
jgi:hypothetical protein